MALNRPDDRLTGSEEPQERQPLPQATLEVFRSCHRYLVELLDLLTLELRYSGLMLGSVAAMALIAALAAFTIWALLNGALLMALVGWGWSWPAALVSLAVLNGVLLLGALWQMRRALARIGLDNTRQALGLETTDVPE